MVRAYVYCSEGPGFEARSCEFLFSVCQSSSERVPASKRGVQCDEKRNCGGSEWYLSKKLSPNIRFQYEARPYFLQVNDILLGLL